MGWMLQDLFDEIIIEESKLLYCLPGQSFPDGNFQIFPELVVWIERESPFLFVEDRFGQIGTYSFPEKRLRFASAHLELDRDRERQLHQIEVKEGHSRFEAMSHRDPIFRQ